MIILFGICRPESTQAEQDSPNIILILADDLGRMDAACFAHHETGVPVSRMFYEKRVDSPFANLLEVYRRDHDVLEAIER